MCVFLSAAAKKLYGPGAGEENVLRGRFNRYPRYMRETKCRKLHPEVMTNNSAAAKRPWRELEV